MGSFDMKCGVTGMWIRRGDPVVLVPLQRSFFPHEGRKPWPMSAHAVMSDYELNSYMGRSTSEYADGAEAPSTLTDGAPDWRDLTRHEASLGRSRSRGHVYVSNSGATALFSPSFAPIYGKYADYGDITPDDSPHHAVLESRLGIPLTEMLDIMRDHRVSREMDPSKDPLPRWEATAWIHRHAWDAFVKASAGEPFRWLHEESELLALGFTPIAQPLADRDLAAVHPDARAQWMGDYHQSLYEYVENGKRVVMAAENGQGWYLVTVPVLAKDWKRLDCFAQFKPLLQWAIANDMPELARRLCWTEQRLMVESRITISNLCRQIAASAANARASGSVNEADLYHTELRYTRMVSRFSSEPSYELLRANLDDLADHGLLDANTDSPLKLAITDMCMVTTAMHMMFKPYLPGQYGGQCGHDEEGVYAAAVARIKADHDVRYAEWEEADCDENGNGWVDGPNLRTVYPDSNIGRFGTQNGCDDPVSESATSAPDADAGGAGDDDVS